MNNEKIIKQNKMRNKEQIKSKIIIREESIKLKEK